jgi:YD repeat-containing protein
MNGVSTRTQTFTYDPLNRIATAKTNSTTGTKCWGETFSYDPWGNSLTIGGVSGYSACMQENLAVTATLKNQVGTNTYDSAGNLTNVTSPSASYTYDAEHDVTATSFACHRKWERVRRCPIEVRRNESQLALGLRKRTGLCG